jgi:hypothetical protein
MAIAPARRRRTRIVLALAAGIAMLAAGCGHHGSSRPGSAEKGGAGAKQRSEAGRLDLAMVAVSARIGHREVRSSGTVIDGDRGLILTSAHSVWGATSVKLQTGVAVLHGRIVARSPCDDIALVETQPWVPGLAALPQAQGGLAPGPLTAIERAWDGRVTSIPARAARGALPSVPLLSEIKTGMSLRGALAPQASGGPLLDSAGRIAGVVTVARGRAAAVPMSLVHERLDDLRPGPGTIFAGWSEYYRCAPRQHAYAAAEYPGFRRRDARLEAPVRASRLEGTGGLDG